MKNSLNYIIDLNEDRNRFYHLQTTSRLNYDILYNDTKKFQSGKNIFKRNPQNWSTIDILQYTK